MILFFVWQIILQFNISQTELKEKIEEFIFKQIKLPKEDVIIEYKNLPNEINQKTKYELKVMPEENQILRGNVSLPLEIFSEGKMEKRILVSLKIRTFENCCLAVNPIPSGETILDKNIEIKKIETTSFTQEVVHLKNECVGKKAKRAIGKDRVILLDAIEELPVIERGKVITLLSKTNGVVVSAKVEAQQDGRVGEIIYVKLQTSKERIKAKVVDSLSVIVVQ